MNLTNFNFINTDIPPTKITKEKYKIYEGKIVKMLMGANQLNKILDVEGYREIKVDRGRVSPNYFSFICNCIIKVSKS